VLSIPNFLSRLFIQTFHLLIMPLSGFGQKNAALSLCYNIPDKFLTKFRMLLEILQKIG